MNPRGATILMALLAVDVAGCDFLEPLEEGSATYQLARWNGESVPVDEGPLPSRFGGESPCHAIVTQGALSLDPARGRYAHHVITRSSCDHRILSNRWGTGVQNGSVVLFRDRDYLLRR